MRDAAHPRPVVVHRWTVGRIDPRIAEIVRASHYLPDASIN